jgi:dipeptidyl aminopeptidase/acylaminoacyl peptidase
MNRIKPLALAFAAAAAPCMPLAARAGTIAEDIRGLMSTPDYHEVALSPDHHTLAWVEAVGKPGDASIGRALHVAAEGKDLAPIAVEAPHTAGGKTLPEEDSPAWSPDSATLAFLSDAEAPGQKQLYLFDTHGRQVRRLTSVKGYLATPHWSPDGRSIAVLLTEGSAKVAGPLEAAAPVSGVVGAQIFEQRLAIVDVSSGSLRMASPADLYVYEYDWAPDGRRLVGTAAHGSGDNNWYVAELYVFDAASGAARSILKTPMQIAAPRWSPDGEHIAFVGGLSSDESIASGDAYLISADGGTPRNLTPGRRASTFSVTWIKPDRLLLADAENGGSALAELNVKTGALHGLYQDAVTLRGPADLARGISVAADGKTSAVIRESFSEPPAIWSGPIGAWKRRTSAPAAAPMPWGKASSVEWRSDKFTVQGWLLPPKNIEPGRKYPMIVYVHGGPAWLTAPEWPRPLGGTSELLAAHDYFVFYPNPRGSSGFGEDFKSANVKDFGGGDLRDILAGVDKVVATQPIDDHRVGITGWSYGGYMTMWALTQTQRFRAGVVGAGLADWLSYYGENGIDEWMIPYFGSSVYDDPAVYAKSSPINFIKQVHTPTLLVVGDSDVECPTPQSFEYWHALEDYKVKTQLVVYAHEGHQFHDPNDDIDVMQRMLAWFDENMPPARD